MDKKIAGLIGAVSAFVALDGAQAATNPVNSDPMSVQTYADLLTPIPNAVALLAADGVNATPVPATGSVQVAYHHHHHRYHRRHHHHRYYNHG